MGRAFVCLCLPLFATDFLALPLCTQPPLSSPSSPAQFFRPAEGSGFCVVSVCHQRECCCASASDVCDCGFFFFLTDFKISFICDGMDVAFAEDVGNSASRSLASHVGAWEGWDLPPTHVKNQQTSCLLITRKTKTEGGRGGGVRLSRHCCVCVCVHLPVFPNRGSKSNALRLLSRGFLSGCPLSRALLRAEGRFATLRAAAVYWNESVEVGVARSPGQEPQPGRPLHPPLSPRLPPCHTVAGWPRQSGGSRIPPASTEVLRATVDSVADLPPGLPAPLPSPSPGEEPRKLCTGAPVTFLDCTLSLLPRPPFLLYGSVAKNGREMETSRFSKHGGGGGSLLCGGGFWREKDAYCYEYVCVQRHCCCMPPV